MRYAGFVLGFVVLLAVSVGAAVGAEFKPDAHTLFLAHFNTGIKADSSVGQGGAHGNACITSGKKGKYGEALVLSKRPSEYAITPVSSVQYSTEKNFPTGDEGTVEFYFKLFKNPNDYGKGRQTFFKIYSNELGDDKTMQIFFDRGPEGPASPLYFWVNSKPENGYTAVATSTTAIEKDKWYHIAAAWNKDDVYLFLNGNLAAKSRKVKFPELAPRMEFGGWYYEGLMDEIRISDICRYTKNFNPEDGQ